MPETTDLDAAADSWMACRPVPSARLEADAPALRRFVEEGDALLRRLPAKGARTAGQEALAQRLLQACRGERQAFLHRHVRAIYAELVRDAAGHRALSTLAFAAAERYPGLVPTRSRLAEERGHLQAGKEGHEIDQGLFFAAVLREPDLGLDLTLRLLRPTDEALALLPAFARDRRLALGKLTLEARDGAARLTVHNADCLNAEDDDLIDQMETAVDIALLDDACAVGLLRGGEMTHPRHRGRRVFSAGIDLRALHEGRISFVDFLLRREFGYINKMAHGLRLPSTEAGGLERAIEKPWVAAVDAFAIGGGAQILLVCDHVIASAESYFALPAAQEGIVPGAANLRLPRIAGSRLARQVILSGRRLQAREPEAACVFDEVVEAPAMDAAIEARLARLAGPAVIPNRRMIGLCEEPLESFRAYMAQFAVEQAARLYSPDVLEKVRRP